MNRIILPLAVLCSACMQSGASSAAPVATSQQELSNSLCPASVPAALGPAADQALLRVFAAEGVQIYRCNLTATGAYAWVFESPDAILLATDQEGWDDDGDRRIVGHHFAGPTWEFKDKSTVVGARVAGATVDPTAIPWLLLNAASHGGSGLFSGVTSIQRLDTVGGLAPASGCSATTAGTVARVPYTANYFFYRTRAGDNTSRQCR
jgi:hypothetical protein